MRHVVPGNGVYHWPGYAFYLELYGCCLALGLFFTPAKEEIRNVRIMVRPHCLTEYRGWLIMQGNKLKALKSYLQINQFCQSTISIHLIPLNLQCLSSGCSVYLIPIYSLFSTWCQSTASCHLIQIYSLMPLGTNMLSLFTWYQSTVSYHLIPIYGFFSLDTNLQSLLIWCQLPDSNLQLPVYMQVLSLPTNLQFLFSRFQSTVSVHLCLFKFTWYQSTVCWLDIHLQCLFSLEINLLSFDTNLQSLVTCACLHSLDTNLQSANLIFIYSFHLIPIYSLYSIQINPQSLFTWYQSATVSIPLIPMICSLLSLDTNLMSVHFIIIYSLCSLDTNLHVQSLFPW